MSRFINQSLLECGNRLEEKLKELLWPHQNSHPSTQNPLYRSRVSVNLAKELSCSQTNSDDEHEEDCEDEVVPDASWAEIALKLNYHPDLVHAARTLDSSDAYYDVSIPS